MYERIDKNSIRKEMISKRSNLTPEYIQSYEKEIVEKFITTKAFLTSEVIMLYMDFRKEAPTKLILKACVDAGKKIILPLTNTQFQIIPYEIPTGKNIIDTLSFSPNAENISENKSDKGKPQNTSAEISYSADNYLFTSKLGITEPNPNLCPIANPAEIDLIIVPGVAFDQKGNRLGYGKGCYDQFLPKLHKNAIKLGLAYHFQILKELPSESTDIKMDFILSD